MYEAFTPEAEGRRVERRPILYSFPTAKQGYLPNGDLVFDSAGNLYGATVFGGGKGTTCDPFYQYCGAVFELSPPKTKRGMWTEKVLHAFASGTDGASPNGGLVLDSKGPMSTEQRSEAEMRAGSAVPQGAGPSLSSSRHPRRASHGL